MFQELDVFDSDWFSSESVCIPTFPFVTSTRWNKLRTFIQRVCVLFVSGIILCDLLTFVHLCVTNSVRSLSQPQKLPHTSLFSKCLPVSQKRHFAGASRQTRQVRLHDTRKLCFSRCLFVPMEGEIPLRRLRRARTTVIFIAHCGRHPTRRGDYTPTTNSQFGVTTTTHSLNAKPWQA